MISDEYWMAQAIEQARLAEQQDEIPVGAIVVCQDQVIARGFNQPIGLSDPSAHAEMLALREAGLSLQNYRMPGCTLYVTLEPCPMCAGLIVHSRIERVVFGAADYKTGAAGSLMNLCCDSRLNHQVAVQGGVMAEECGELLSAFFKAKRAHKKKMKKALQRSVDSDESGSVDDA